MQTVRQTPPCRDIAPGIARQDHPGLHQHPRSQRVCLPNQAPSAPGACSGPHCLLLECSGELLSIPLNLLHCIFTLLCRIPHQQNLPNYTARSIFVSAIKSLPSQRFKIILKNRLSKVMSAHLAVNSRNTRVDLVRPQQPTLHQQSVRTFYRHVCVYRKTSVLHKISTEPATTCHVGTM